MTHTLSAVFEHRTDANYARDALISAGFDGHAIQLSDAGNAASAARQQDVTASPGATDESMLDSVRHFFGRLFGTEHDDQRMMAEAIRRGHVVLTVHCAGREQAERAAGMLQAFSPADMSAQQAREDAGDWRRADAAMQQSAPGARQDAGVRQDAGTRQDAGSRQETAARQDGGARTDAPPNQGSLNLQRGDSPGLSEDSYFHAHWVETFSYAGGSYQEYDPAYRYGASMAGSTTYQGSAWDEVEPALREEWQRTYPNSRWEKFKEAVRVGWNRMTH